MTKETEPVVKPGTIIRFPIVVTGFIELRNLKDVRVVVDPYDWEYAAWPRVSPYGDTQTDLVQIEDDQLHKRIEADVDIVTSLRTLAELRLDNGTDWRISHGANEGITGHTSYE